MVTTSWIVALRQVRSTLSSISVEPKGGSRYQTSVDLYDPTTIQSTCAEQAACKIYAFRSVSICQHIQSAHFLSLCLAYTEVEIIQLVLHSFDTWD